MDVQELRCGNAIIRIHPGKRTKEERKEMVENATAQFVKAIEKKHPGYFKHRSSVHQG